MKLRIPLLTVALCGILMALASAQAHAATVRGRLVHSNSSPATGIKVEVVDQQGVKAAKAYSGPDGMYYLQGVPPGTYFLKIWIYPDGKPVVYQIKVVEPNTDMPQINVP